MTALDQAQIPPSGFEIVLEGFGLELSVHEGKGDAALVVVHRPRQRHHYFIGSFDRRYFRQFATAEGDRIVLLVPSHSLEQFHSEDEVCLGCAPCPSLFQGAHSLETLEAYFAPPPGCLMSGYGEYPQQIKTLGFPSFGCFGYVHAEASSEVALPYMRLYQPDRPLHVEQLPLELVAQVSRCELPFAFAEMPLVQPAEHAYCSLNGRRYLDYQQRVVPGA